MQIVLLDLVKQRLVADLQQSRGLLPMPVGLLESMRDSRRFSFFLHATSQKLQATQLGLP